MARTILRLEGFATQLAYRSGALAKLLAAYGAPEVLEGEDSARLWRGVRDCEFLAEPATPRSGASPPRRRAGRR